MNSPGRFTLPVIAVLLLFCLFQNVQAAADVDYSTTYIITVMEDGTAFWKIEYRTPLLTDEDTGVFENYSRNLNNVYLPELRSLMQQSVSQAALGTSRAMAVKDFTGNAAIQTSPTGSYGIVTYTFTWTNFARSGDGIAIGDAFVGGMYLARGNTLIIRYPQGYTVASVDPAPDQTSTGLTWYGLRSIGPGQPAVTLKNTAFPLLPLLGGGLILVLVAGGLLLYRQKRIAVQERDMDPLPEPDGTEEPAPALSKADLESLQDRIIQLLVAHNGELFQSEIVRILGLPKSTVSTTLNELHRLGIVQKVRKGRENLIRLVRDRG